MTEFWNHLKLFQLLGTKTKNLDWIGGCMFGSDWAGVVSYDGSSEHTRGICFHLEGRWEDSSHMHAKARGMIKNKFLDEDCISNNYSGNVTMHLCRGSTLSETQICASLTPGLDFFMLIKLIVNWVSYVAN